MFSPETAVMETPTVTDSERRTNPPIVESIPFAYQEQTPVSEAMFLGTLVNVVSGVVSRLAPIIAEALPHLLPGIGSLLTGGSSNGGVAAKTNGANNGRMLTIPYCKVSQQ
jgi:hypothetical protein